MIWFENSGCFLCCRTRSCSLWLTGRWSPSFVKTTRMTRKSTNSWTRCKHPHLLSLATLTPRCSIQIVEMPSKRPKTCWCETNKQIHFYRWYTHKNILFANHIIFFVLLIAWITRSLFSSSFYNFIHHNNNKKQLFVCDNTIDLKN